MDKVKERASSLRHRAAHAGKHYGREWSKFHFDLVVQTVDNIPDMRGATGMLVTCMRGPKVMSTSEGEVVDGKAVWNERMSVVCTMYASKKPDKRWSDKVYRISLCAVMPGEFGTHKKKLTEVAGTDIDLAEYVRTSEAEAREPVLLRLSWKAKPVFYATLRTEIGCRWLRDLGAGSPSPSDARSISSNLTGFSPHTGPSAGSNEEQNLEGFDDGTRQSPHQRAAALARARMGKLGVIREGLHSKRSERRVNGSEAQPAGARAAGRGSEGSEAAAIHAAERLGPADQPPLTPGGAGGAAVHTPSSSLPSRASPAPAGGGSAHAQPADGSDGRLGAGHAGGEERPGLQDEGRAPAGAASAAAYAQPHLGGPGAQDGARDGSAPGAPPGSGAAAPRQLKHVDPWAQGGFDGTPPGAEHAQAEHRSSEELAELRAELAAAREERERAVAEAVAAQQAARSLQAALHQRGAHADAAVVTESPPGARDAELVAELDEQRRLTAELRAELLEVHSALQERSRELESAQHTSAQLTRALAQHEGRAARGAAAGEEEEEEEEDMARTELQLALVEAKMALATVEFEGEQARHEARTVAQELEKVRGGSRKVAEEMTWLEVKYQEARSELVRLKHHNASLEDDVKDLITLRLELAEAQARIEELEGQHRSHRGGAAGGADAAVPRHVVDFDSDDEEGLTE